MDSNIPCEGMPAVPAVNPSFWKVEKSEDGKEEKGSDTPLTQEELPVQFLFGDPDDTQGVVEFDYAA